MMKRNIKRRGFTLVELLIVIVVIGILSAMMMLSSTEAVTSAKASNIVSNLRNLKTAALAMYIDSMDQFDSGKAKIKDASATGGNTESGTPSTGTTTEVDINNVVKYMNGGQNFEDTNYSILANNEGWFLKYEIKGTGTETAQIKQKLAGRAKAVGLLKDATNKATTTGEGKDATTNVVPYDGTTEFVYYFVR